MLKVEGPRSINFRAESETNKGRTYHKTHAGIKVGGAMSGIAIAGNLLNRNGLSEVNEYLKLAEEYGAEHAKAATKSINTFKKYLLPITAFAIVTHLSCGAIVDHIRNKKAADVADQLVDEGPVKAMETNDRIKLTNSYTPYYKSNDGKKYGSLLGLGVAALLAPFSFKLTKSLMKHSLAELEPAIEKYYKKTMVTTLGITLATIGTLGGLIMGSITDTLSNKSAKKISAKEELPIYKIL